MEAPRKEKEKEEETVQQPKRKRKRLVASFRLFIINATLLDTDTSAAPYIICSVSEGQTQSGINTTRKGADIHFNCTFYFEEVALNDTIKIAFYLNETTLLATGKIDLNVLPREGVLVRNFKDLELVGSDKQPKVRLYARLEKIFIIDDHITDLPEVPEQLKPQFRALYAEMLEAQGYQPLSAEDKEKILQTAAHLQERKIDLDLFLSTRKARKGVSASSWTKEMTDNLGFIFEAVSRLEQVLPRQMHCSDITTVDFLEAVVPCLQPDLSANDIWIHKDFDKIRELPDKGIYEFFIRLAQVLDEKTAGSGSVEHKVDELLTSLLRMFFPLPDLICSSKGEVFPLTVASVECSADPDKTVNYVRCSAEVLTCVIAGESKHWEKQNKRDCAFARMCGEALALAQKNKKLVQLLGRSYQSQQLLVIRLISDEIAFFVFEFSDEILNSIAHGQRPPFGIPVRYYCNALGREGFHGLRLGNPSDRALIFHFLSGWSWFLRTNNPFQDD